MARTVINLNYNCSFEDAFNRFKNQEKNGEEYWKKGTGLMTAMQFIKLEFSDGALTLSAWVQAGIGSFGGSEMDLSGVTAAIPKKSLMNVIEKN